MHFCSGWNLPGTAELHDQSKLLHFLNLHTIVFPFFLLEVQSWTKKRVEDTTRDTCRGRVSGADAFHRLMPSSLDNAELGTQAVPYPTKAEASKHPYRKRFREQLKFHLMETQCQSFDTLPELLTSRSATTFAFVKGGLNLVHRGKGKLFQAQHSVARIASPLPAPDGSRSACTGGQLATWSIHDLGHHTMSLLMISYVCSCHHARQEESCSSWAVLGIKDIKARGKVELWDCILESYF